ncbi:hypothetical protein H8S20_17410 [Clostridium sp. NSJ-6]|uniref:Uncharacterized protein n=1 Tax=Clostridium hominis TaxID=2763036 RepID=A0ABR7DGV9_9CLOT|nr:hypothetical protein [Clostridium hominis]MBC5630639.1 hypothetical protein [Clostridium hominis]
MARKFDISFKNITKENILFDYFNSLEDRGNIIKTILWDWYVNNIKENQKELIIEDKKDSKLDMDVTDF